MINAGVAFGHKQVAHLRWTRDCSLINWEEFVHCQVRANETSSQPKRQFSVRSSDVLMVLSCPFWSTVLTCGVRLQIHTLNYWIV